MFLQSLCDLGTCPHGFSFIYMYDVAILLVYVSKQCTCYAGRKGDCGVSYAIQ